MQQGGKASVTLFRYVALPVACGYTLAL